ncbi:MAG: YafY family transcriptional regulator [Oscillospiraceae bacterium]|nr:YafY family transcriptional regulator [Oscillospiraceae bacterium]
MKIDRLVGILSILLQKDKVTAEELADKFEVSTRTIFRDIETINLAGIPIFASRGSKGGISIMEGFRIDKTLLSVNDMRAIFSGLQSLDSVCGTNRYIQLMNKLNVNGIYGDQMIIDLSMWDKSSISPKIELIRAAIDLREMISFTYYSPERTEERKIEPYRLIFQWSSWYVWGFCEKRQNYRMFKLSRMTDLKNTHTSFEKRNIPEYTCDKLRHTKGDFLAKVRFNKSVKWRIIDEFGTVLPRYDDEGNIYLDFSWMDKPSLFRYILTFGDDAEIISPESARKEFSELVKKISDKYDIQQSY